MLPSWLSRARWFLLAAASVAAVTLLRLSMERTDLALGRPYLLFALAIVVSSWWGGFGPGLFATALCALVIDYYFLPPRFSFVAVDAEQVVPLVLFVVQGLFISWLGDVKVRALRDLRRVRAELEHRVEQRTGQLQESNRNLAGQVEANLAVADELRVQADQLTRSNRELQDFASVASHDLQEPLRKIQAFGDRLRVKCAPQLGEEGNDYLTRMQSAAGRMQVLINDLLTFSRVTTQARPFEPVDLNAVAADVVSNLEARIEQTGGRVEVGDLPTIDADAMQMGQLLQNLVGNGLKFHKPGEPPAIHVSARVVAASGGRGSGDDRADGAAQPAVAADGFGAAAGLVCEIAVRDSGIGFDEKYLDRIFDIFQRLHGRGSYEGTGVGLAVCRKIVERHGGTITARSRPGQGATFVVALPVRHGLDAHAADARRVDAAPPASAHAATPAHDKDTTDGRPDQADHHPARR